MLTVTTPKARLDADRKPPAYNHTRGDSPLAPCPECAPPRPKAPGPRRRAREAVTVLYLEGRYVVRIRDCSVGSSRDERDALAQREHLRTALAREFCRAGDARAKRELRRAASKIRGMTEDAATCDCEGCVALRNGADAIEALARGGRKVKKGG